MRFYDDNGNFGPADLKDATCPMSLLVGYKHLGDSKMKLEDWLAKYKPNGVSFQTGQNLVTRFHHRPLISYLARRFGHDQSKTAFYFKRESHCRPQPHWVKACFLIASVGTEQHSSVLLARLLR